MGEISHTPFHWAEDDELRERFVLRQMEPSQARDCEAHLATCASCKNKVATEQELIAGIRHVGREDLKRRLSRRVNVPPPHVSTWRASAAIAAGMAFLLVTAVATVWVLQRQGEQTATEDQEIAQKVETESRGMEKKGMEKAEEAISGEDRRDGTTPRTTVEKPESAIGAKHRDLSERSPGQSEPSTHTRPASPAPDRSISEPIPPRAAARQRTQADKEWIIGTLLASWLVEQGPEPSTQEGRAVLPKDEAKMRAKGESTRKPGQTSALLPQITLRQSPVTDLPLPTKSQFADAGTAGVMTLAERSSDGLTLTLYLDSLFAMTDLQRAQVERITGDSVVVQVSIRRFGYKLPSGWLPQ